MQSTFLGPAPDATPRKGKKPGAKVSIRHLRWKVSTQISTFFNHETGLHRSAKGGSSLPRILRCPHVKLLLCPGHSSCSYVMCKTDIHSGMGGGQHSWEPQGPREDMVLEVRNNDGVTGCCQNAPMSKQLH